MKAILLSAILVVSALTSAASAATTEELLAQAQKAYSERDYDNAGIQRAQDAADLYGQAAAQSAEAKAKAKFLIAQSEALYFVGNANEANAVKIEKHLMGKEVADQGLKLLGIADVTEVTPEQVQTLKASADLDLIVEGVYQRGINLGQWGAANGVMESLGKWPELRNSMQLIIDLGKKDLHEYGPYRTLGRGYYKIPALMGGSMKKADKYLATAVSSTLVAGQIYSINGYNNLYYAEVLKENGEDAKAQELLQAFVVATPAQLTPAGKTSPEPEALRAQVEAAALLKSW